MSETDEATSAMGETIGDPATEPANRAASETANAEAIPTLDVEAIADLEQRVVAALKTCYDPEIPVDIYELGLIYDVEVEPGPGGATVELRMTLTSPACPVAGSLPGEVEQKVQGVDGVEKASVELVWDPPWTPEMMSEGARLDLGFL
jgi:FeS assembly SUF system protein